jgi:IS5 family transposase
MSHWVVNRDLSLDALRIDSTVVDSNIAPPSDSQFLNDGVRVLSRLMSYSKTRTGVEIRFVDQRKRSKSLAFRISHAKKGRKNSPLSTTSELRRHHLYGKRTRRSLRFVVTPPMPFRAQLWVRDFEHYRALLLKVIDQAQRRVFNGKKLLVADKIVSLFEPHTDIIIKGARDVQYGTRSTWPLRAMDLSPI